MNYSNSHDMVFILPLLSGGGAERVSLNLLTGLSNRGYSIGIIVFKKSGPLYLLIPREVPVYNLNTVTLRSSIIPLIKKIQHLKPKVVFSTLGYINMALLSIRWLLPCKVKIWVREANLPSISISNNMHPKLINTLYWLLYKTADKVICTSERMKDEFILNYRVPDKIINVLPNPVDVSAIHRSLSSIKRFDKGGVCYIAAGRLTFQKGFDRLLYWFSELGEDKATLTILGDGKFKNKLMNETKLLNLQEQVKFIGFCDNPWEWYAGADVFLLSSRWEGMPNAVLESLACGTSVIATAESGGIKEIIEQDINCNIIITTKSQEFIEFMKEVKVKNKDFELQSLLPERYKKENVIHIVEGWLNELK